MAGFLLLHGAWHGTWCWRRLVPRLAELGHSSDTVDLTCTGVGGPAAEAYDARVRAVTSALLGADEPPVVVAHSMAGVVATEVVSRWPDRVRSLVYLSAFVPADGESMMDLGRTGLEGSAVAPLYRADGARGVSVVDVSGVADAFYGRSPAADIAYSVPRLQPESLVVEYAPARVDTEGLRRTEQFFVECLDDRAIPPAKQRAMSAGLPASNVVSLDTDHSPFFSDPGGLAATLHELAQRR